MPIHSIAVIGGGLMGTGIATACLASGFEVTLIETRVKALEAAQKNIRTTFDRDVTKGRLSTEEAATRIARLTASSFIADAAEADLVIEAAFEEMSVKEAIFRALDRIAKPTAILASNTSGLDLNVIAGFTTRPERIIGLHFFSPANIMRLLEVVRGDATSPEVLATAMALARKMGKVGVVSGVCDGFIGNRVLEEYLRQAYFIAEEGATPQQIDAALEAFGMAMGPFRMLDMAGQDVAWSVRKRRMTQYPDRPYSGFLDILCQQGRFGQKTGKGVYVYHDGRTAEVDPEVEPLLIAYSTSRGIDRRPISDEEIVERCLFAMINEAARAVQEGIAARPVDVDIVYLAGYGFPGERGGPMFYADRIGLPKVLERIRALAAGRNGWAWKPAALLTDLVASGKTFESLNN